MRNVQKTLQLLCAQAARNAQPQPLEMRLELPTRDPRADEPRDEDDQLVVEMSTFEWVL